MEAPGTSAEPLQVWRVLSALSITHSAMHQLNILGMLLGHVQ